MSGFISKAACRGRRPSHFLSYSGYQRQNLVTRLLKERGVARFVVAPSGYGKTYLAVDYAETVFSWVHAFFINCESPCFIRDLDDDSISAACLKADAEARLVVFDAVPPLDAERAKRFSAEMDALLAAGCEVLVTCAPSADAYGQLQPDQVRLGAADLLLSDDELDAARSLDDRNRTPSSQIGMERRVPALAWGSGPEAADLFLRRCFQEPMPIDLLLAMASMYALQEGSFGALRAIGPIDAGSVGQLLATYPHLGDEGRGGFRAPSVPAGALAQALKGVMGALVERSAFSTRAELACAWGDALLTERGSAERACDIVRMLCPRSHRGRWVAAHALDLVRLGCFYPALDLVRASSTRAADLPQADRDTVSLLEAACLMVLGDEAGAVSCAKRLAFNGDAPAAYRTICQLLIAHAGAGSPERNAQAALEETAVAASDSACAGAVGPDLPEALALAWRARRRGPDELGAVWSLMHEAGVRYEALCMAAAALFSHMGKRAEGGMASSATLARHAAAAERFVRDRLESDGPVPADYFVAYAGLEMERAHVAGMGFAGGPLATGILLDLRNAEMALLRQRQQLARQIEAESAKPSAYAPPLPEGSTSLRRDAVLQRPKRNVPILELKTFGRFELALGGEPLEGRGVRRKSPRALLVLLAINQGRELSRESAMRSLWPKSSEDVARKNFYSVWSQLKNTLTLPDGTCPYLVRHQYGCALEERYVQSDITRLADICRELLFGRPDVQEWSDLYTELDRDFAGDFMPTESSIPMVVSAREEYRTRLVDALVAATTSIVGAGNPQWGIWFARMAVTRDELREDAYVALMRAQAAADQRTAAIMTFLNCQRILSEKLGVDPSPETMALYESLLD